MADLKQQIHSLLQRRNGLTRLVSYMRQEWKLIALSLLVLMLTSALTAFKAWLIQPMLDSILNKTATLNGLYLCCGLLAGLFLFQGLLAYVYSMFCQVPGARVVRAMRRDLFDHIQARSLGTLASRSSSDLTSRVVNDVATFQMTAVTSVQSLGHHLMLIVFLLTVMFIQDGRLAFISIGVIGVVGILLLVLGRHIKRLSLLNQSGVSAIARQMSEMIGGIEVILSFGLTKHWRERFGESNQAHFRSTIDLQKMRALAVSAIQIVVGLGLALMLLVVGSSLLNGTVEASEVGSFVACMFLLQAPTMGVGTEITRLIRGLSSGARALEILDDEQGIPDPPVPVPLPSGPLDIEFRNVTFNYQRQPVVEDISFNVKAGEIVAMVGASGAGKSTLARLLLRFYRPDRGEVLLNGISVEDVAQQDLYQSVSSVSQEVFLFEDTLRYNLTIGRPDASPEELKKVIHAACLDDFIRRLPEGLDTPIGERGFGLSGGERQRVAIARALLKDPRVLILDEATSALDTDLERRLLRQVRESQGLTILAITHRLAVAEIADRVVVLKDGTLVEDGAAGDLVAMGGEYSRLKHAASGA